MRNRKKRYKKLAAFTLSMTLLFGTMFSGISRTYATGNSTLTNTSVQTEMLDKTTISSDNNALSNLNFSQMKSWCEDARVAVHDPSIVQDPETGRYYLFGSHLSFAWSDDLENWTSFENNLTNDTARSMFASEIEWCKKADANYDIEGDLWAPDVIWNKDMGKWCMYMSINGPLWNSTISLLTADSLDGDWTYVGPVIQSGMSNGFGPTFDYQKVMGNEDVSRFTSNLDNYNTPKTEAHAIDPSVIYDENGQLWMSYGSWSGGISLIALDGKTGLRDYSVTYENTWNSVGSNGYISDPYTGYKIAGGNTVSGEGSYLQKLGDYYYLYLSYGWYAPEGGYNMRVFRSKDIRGPYKDVSGDDARTALNNNAGQTNGSTGLRLMSYYRWNFQEFGHTAQGHNSALTDSKTGKTYVIYHDKFDDGTVHHSVRVHQTFTNEDGWLVAAPFEYQGETLSDSGYETEQFTGNYSIIIQKQDVDYENLQCVTEEAVTLESGTAVEENGRIIGYQGTITGAYTGTWSTKTGTPYITLKMGGETYKGVLSEGTLEETNIKSMTFSAVSEKDECIWGYHLDAEEAIFMTMEKNMDIPKTVTEDITLPTEGFQGTAISWESNHIALSNTGKVLYLTEDSDVTLTATITSNGQEYKKDYDVKVLGSNSLSNDNKVLLASYFTDSPVEIAALEKGDCSIKNPFYQCDEDLSKGVEISFEVKRTADASYLSDIIAILGDSGRLYFTGGSYLGYNGPGGYYDANVNYWSAAEDYLKTGEYVVIRMAFSSDGFYVYADDQCIYSKQTLQSGETKGSYVPNENQNLDVMLLDFLRNDATRVHVGYGSWWSEAFHGELRNLNFYYTQLSKNVSGLDMTAYFEALENAEQYLAEQAEKGCYTLESISNLQSVVTKAKEELTSDIDSSKQYLVNEHTNALNEAMENLQIASYQIQVLEVEGGYVTGLASDGIYQAGDMLTLRAVANEGYTFEMWTDTLGNVLGTDTSYTEKVSCDRIVYPVFRSNASVTTMEDITTTSATETTELDGETTTVNYPVTTEPEWEDTTEYASNTSEANVENTETDTTTTDVSATTGCSNTTEDNAGNTETDVPTTNAPIIPTSNAPVTTETDWEATTGCSNTTEDNAGNTEMDVPTSNAPVTTETDWEATTAGCSNTTEDNAGNTEMDVPTSNAPVTTETDWEATTAGCSNTTEDNAGNTEMDVPTSNAPVTTETDWEATTAGCSNTTEDNAGNTEMDVPTSNVPVTTETDWEATTGCSNTTEDNVGNTEMDVPTSNVPVTTETDWEATTGCSNTTEDNAGNTEMDVPTSNVPVTTETDWEATTGCSNTTEDNAGNTEMDVPTSNVPVTTETDWEATTGCSNTTEDNAGNTEMDIPTSNVPVTTESDCSTTTSTIFNNSEQENENVGNTVNNIITTEHSVLQNSSSSSFTQSQTEVAASVTTEEINQIIRNPILAGTMHYVSGIRYMITENNPNQKTVMMVSVKSKKIQKAVIPDYIVIQGTEFKVSEIGRNAFANCKQLKRVVIGANVSVIRSKAFYKCKKLKIIKINSLNIKKVESNVLKKTSSKVLIKVPAKKIKKYKRLFGVKKSQIKNSN